MAPHPLRRILITGATGKQGGALISSLTSQPTPSFEIYALTRNPNSKSAQALASRPNIKLVQGDFSNPTAIFAQIPSPWGLFSVTNPMNATREEAQGKAMTAAAIAAGVRHIVFTATDRGGASETDATSVPHFASKFAIEKDIIAKSAQSGGTYTFLRPVAFYENLSDDFLGRAFVALWRLNGDKSRIKFVSTKDIGRVGAGAFLHSGEEEYKNKAVALAGDDVSLREAEEVFRMETGRRLPETYAFVARGLKGVLHEQLGIMFNWFKSDGFGVDIADARGKYPFVKDFRVWLKTESAWQSE
ncbi:hypothetical protein N0V90_000395 [Kalmusia sp. IMI 367209]|nr:hypothetical protein N0V90_000395 [Kalmusia sp. IMI 367209]